MTKSRLLLMTDFQNFKIHQVLKLVRISVAISLHSTMSLHTQISQRQCHTQWCTLTERRIQRRFVSWKVKYSLTKNGWSRSREKTSFSVITYFCFFSWIMCFFSKTLTEKERSTVLMAFVFSYMFCTKLLFHETCLVEVEVQTLLQFLMADSVLI